MSYIEWPNKRAVGSCYCLDQSPGAERFGGLTITLRRRAGEIGVFGNQATSFRNMPHVDQSVAEYLSKFAEEGVRDAAHALKADLDNVDIIFSDFAYHPVDSRGDLYRHAARSAFRSAWEAWQRFRNVEREV